MKYILITGVSSGIGKSASEAFIKKGYHIFGSVRDENSGARIASSLGKNFTPILFDIADETAVRNAVIQVKEKLGENGLTALINNAGIAVAGALSELPVSEFRKQIDVNLIGTFSVIKNFLPLLGTDKKASFPPGRIINISSLSGKRTVPFLGAYSVSKFGVEALTDGLRRELMLYGIDVIGILPGSVNTSLIGKMEDQIDLTPKDSDYAPMLLKFKELNEKKVKGGVPIEKVVAAIVDAVENPNPKTRYVLRTSFLLDFLIPNLLPVRLFDKIIASKLGIIK